MILGWMMAAAAALAPTPYPADYQATVKAYLENTLKDSDSAKVEEIRAPRWAVLGSKHLFVDDRIAGWAVCYRVNAKNSYGAYIGYHRWLMLINGDAVTFMRESPYFNDYAGQELVDDQVEGECARAADEPPNPQGASPVQPPHE